MFDNFSLQGVWEKKVPPLIDFLVLRFQLKGVSNIIEYIIKCNIIYKYTGCYYYDFT